MRILGFSKEKTLAGKMLAFGGAALGSDEGLVALSEERSSRIKYAAGYESSTRAILTHANVALDDVDRIAVSTCCESQDAAATGHAMEADPRLLTINHHLSHASLAFFGSGYESALVMVADGGGNTLEPAPDGYWWEHPREQVSYYVGTRVGLELIGRDFDSPFDVGFGEIFRAFTYFLGWGSSTQASKVMALSAYGNRNAFRKGIFETDHDRLTSPLRNNPFDPIAMIRELSANLSADFGEPREPGQEILNIHRNLAAFVQAELEEAVLSRLRILRGKLGLRKLCLAGGVFLNVLVNGRIVREGLFDEVYVPSAPGDDGQSLGNVIAALRLEQERPSWLPMTTSTAAALAPGWKVNSEVVTSTLRRADASNYCVFEHPEVADTAAWLLEEGMAVCLYRERGEYGPRALGQRSILGDPRSRTSRSVFNAVKDRDWFMPFAPAILLTEVGNWFDARVESPFMSFALPVKPQKKHDIDGVVSADGTSRLQTLSPSDGTLMREIVEAFHRRTGIPLVLNTSFNTGGDPIVESPDDAVQAFKSLSVNALILGRFLIIKELTPDLYEGSLLPRNYPLEISISEDGSRRQLSTSAMTSIDVVRALQTATRSAIFIRHELPLYGEYLEWLREGRKVTTIRFRKGGVELPMRRSLPLFETHDYGVGDRENRTAWVNVKTIRYQRFGELSETDARRDGFSSRQEMRAAFKEIYPLMEDGDWVTIYGIMIAPED